MQRIFNFSPGPAMLPTEVLQHAQAEMLDWQGTGMSVPKSAIAAKNLPKSPNKLEADLRELLAIPANYQVLFALRRSVHSVFDGPFEFNGRSKNR